MKILTRRKSTRRFIFGLLCLLPILILLFEVFRLGDTNTAVEGLMNSLSDLNSFPFTTDIDTWITDTFLDGIGSPWISLVLYYLYYLIYVSAFDLIFSFFFCMIDLFRSWMDKIGGEY